MDGLWVYVLWVVGAYGVGSVPGGEMVGRVKGVDVRSLGTGNPGTANVYREVGPVYGAAVFCLDVAKGGVATLPLFLLDAPSAVSAAAGASVVAGHLFPIPWRSLGGTGLVVAMGASVGLLPAGGVVGAVVAVPCMALTRNAALTGALFFGGCIVSGWLVHRDVVAAGAVLAVAVAVSVKALVQYRER